jgi:hypothetical protein
MDVKRGAPLDVLIRRITELRDQRDKLVLVRQTESTRTSNKVEMTEEERLIRRDLYTLETRVSSRRHNATKRGLKK